MQKLRKSHTNIIVVLYIVLLSALAYQSLRQSGVVEMKSSWSDKRVLADSDVMLDAKAAYVFDQASGRVLYRKNERVPMPIASITKIATAVCALSALPARSTVTINKDDLDQEWNGLKAGDIWYVDDLTTFMLIESSNNAAKSLARAYGGEPAMVSCMNKLAQKLMLYDTKFANATGLDVGGQRGAYGSAKDVAKLLKAALDLYPDIFGKTAYKSYNVTTVTGKVYNAVNTDRAIDEIPSLIASKTGFTEVAGGNLVFAMDAGLNHKIIIAILGSSEDGRFKDAVALSDATTRMLTE